MVFGLREHPGEIAGKNKVSHLFLLIWFFCLGEILRFGSGVWYSGIFGLGGPEILGQALHVQLRSSMLVVGLLMVTMALEAEIDFLAVVEHRLIPVRVRSGWARLKK